MKKAIAVTLCVVSLALIIGVNDNLTYDGVKKAVAYVKGDRSDTDIMEYIQAYVRYWQNYDITVDQTLKMQSHYYPTSTLWYNGRYTGGIGLWNNLDTDDPDTKPQSYISLTSEVYYTSDGNVVDNPGPKSPGSIEPNYDGVVGTMDVEELYRHRALETFFSHKAIDDWYDWIQVPAYFVMVIVGTVYWLSIVLLGSLGGVFCILMACLYLLGLYRGLPA